MSKEETLQSITKIRRKSFCQSVKGGGGGIGRELQRVTEPV